MTDELESFHLRAIQAEREGDTAEAWEYCSGIPMFRRSRHRGLLAHLVAATGELTPWVWARWIVYLALRAEDTGSATAERLRRAREDAGDSLHGDLLDTAYDEGGDPVKVVARVMGESWAFHQLAAYEYGVLESFLDELAGEGLLEHADLARRWVGSAMSGYRIEGRGGPGRLAVCDLADEETARASLDVLDLGAATLAGPEGCVIGRLVPSGTTPALMFDIAPVGVDETTARDVARSTGDGWMESLMVGIEAGRLDGGDLLREDYELMSDVLSLGLLEFGTAPTELARVWTQLERGRDEVGRAAFRVLRDASEGDLDDAAAPYVAAAVLNPHAYDEARRKLRPPGRAEHWRRWADLSTDPARSRLLGLAGASVEADR
jgi:hypothetical protein